MTKVPPVHTVLTLPNAQVETARYAGNQYAYVVAPKQVRKVKLSVVERWHREGRIRIVRGTLREGVMLPVQEINPDSRELEGVDPLDNHLLTLAAGTADAYARSFAIEAILDEFMPLIAHRAGHLSPEDARQEAALAILDAAPAYDPARPAAPYINAIICRRFANLFRRERAQCRWHHLRLIELDKPLKGSSTRTSAGDVTLSSVMADDHQYNVHDDIDNRDAARVAWAKLSSKLSKREKRAFIAHVKGYTFAQIAVMTGTNVKSVGNAIERARKKR